MEESTNLKMLLAGNYILTAFRKSDFNKFVITSVQELSIVSLTELVCTVYPDVLHNIDCEGTKMIMFFSLNSGFYFCSVRGVEYQGENDHQLIHLLDIRHLLLILHLRHSTSFILLLGGE